VLHTVVAAQQSIVARSAGIAAILAAAALYLYVRDRRGKKRRSHRP
jgi:hypothetical protein